MLTKRYILRGILLSIMGVCPIHAMITGTVDIATGLGTDHVSRTQAYFVDNVLSYVSGGVTFSFPAGFFTNNPGLIVTIMLTGRAYSTSEVVVAEVTSNSPTQATVRVNVVSLLDSRVVFEAATGDVDVFLRAAGT